jgi:hypothetical protein
VKSLRGLSQALRGSNGEFELNRVVAFVGGLAYIGGAHTFIAWHMARGGEFDLIAYCAAFPGGLAVAAGGAAAAVAWKDKGVASAQVIRETGAVPAAPPAGPQVPAKPVPDNPDGETS